MRIGQRACLARNARPPITASAAATSTASPPRRLTGWLSAAGAEGADADVAVAAPPEPLATGAGRRATCAGLGSTLRLGSVEAAGDGLTVAIGVGVGVGLAVGAAVGRAVGAAVAAGIGAEPDDATG
jgi:hypothetical protein